MLSAGLVGCESLQRKFTRKPKRPAAPPTPVINFMDYSQTMTPMDRYRKHYMMFNYWNDELIRELLASSPNPKRYRHASGQALQELQELVRLLPSDDAGSRLQTVIDHRDRIHQRLLRGAFDAPGAGAMRRDLESQTRQIHRDFFWRDVEPLVNSMSDGSPASEPAASPDVERVAPVSEGVIEAPPAAAEDARAN